MDAEQKAYLKTIYYDPSHAASYSGLDRLYREVKREGRYNIKRKDLKNHKKLMDYTDRLDEDSKGRE